MIKNISQMLMELVITTRLTLQKLPMDLIIQSGLVSGLLPPMSVLTGLEDSMMLTHTLSKNAKELFALSHTLPVMLLSIAIEKQQFLDHLEI